MYKPSKIEKTIIDSRKLPAQGTKTCSNLEQFASSSKKHYTPPKKYFLTNKKWIKEN